MSGLTRSYLKKIFLSNLCVGSSFQLLGILKYACGLNLGPALTLNKNPIFEMVSIVSTQFHQDSVTFKDEIHRN